MKHFLTLLLLTLCSLSAFAVTHVIAVSGTSYVPSDITITFGDEVQIEASPNHPCQSASWTTFTSTTTLTSSTLTVGTVFFECQFHSACCSMSGSITVQAAPNGISGPAQMPNLIVFPNPFGDQLNVIAPKNDMGISGMRILDLNGKLILNIGIDKEEVSVNTTDLPAGTYIVQFFSCCTLVDSRKITCVK